MIFFARGAKCGCLGAIGFGRGEEFAPRSFRSFKREPSAIEPNPSPQRLKKWRRVIACNARGSLKIFMSCARVQDYRAPGWFGQRFFSGFIEIGWPDCP